MDNPHSSLIFVGYQAEGTLGRAILEGRKTVRIQGVMKDVRIAIHSINGFSAHADQADLLKWCGEMKVPDRAFLVHGEHRSLSAYREKLAETGWKNVHVPALHETVELVEKTSSRSSGKTRK